MTDVLILTANLGYGHQSVANAISSQLKITNPNLKSVIENPFDHPKVPNLISRTQKDYDYYVKRWPQLYKLGYLALDRRLTAEILKDSNIILFHRAISDLILAHRPRLIVNTYPIYHPAIHSTFLRHRNRRVPVVTIVTDLSHVHQLWFHRVSSAVIVASDNIKKKAISHNINPKIVHKYGIPVDPHLTSPQNLSTLKKSLGFDKKRVTLFVVGSPRVHNLVPILNLLNHSLLPLQFIITAGGNSHLFKELHKISWHHPHIIYNQLDHQHMATPLQLSDIVITKAGGIIVTESLALGKPLILIHAIQGQETGNVTFITRHHAGVLTQEPIDTQIQLFNWLHNKHELLNQYTRNAQKIGKPQAAFKTSKLIHKLLISH